MSDCFVRFQRKNWTTDKLFRWLYALTMEKPKWHRQHQGVSFAIYVGNIRIEQEHDHIILITEDEAISAVLRAWAEGPYG